MSHHALRATVAVAVLSFSVLGPPVQAQDNPSAQELADLRARAEAGDADAQLSLGLMYQWGRGVIQDGAEAVRWYRLAAEQGHPQAQFALGYAYDTGEGVPKDGTEAVRWYRVAAEQGRVAAKVNLGGLGVPEDTAEAVRWYRLAAEQGHADAQVNLGFMYYRGRGVPGGAAEAVRWYRLAAEQGHAAGQYNLGFAYDYGRGGAPKTPRKPSGGTAWPPDRVTPAPSSPSGLRTPTVEGVAQDEAEAVQWYRLAAEQGDASAQYALGIAYGTGRGVPEDYVVAHMWLNLAAATGHEDARRMRRGCRREHDARTDRRSAGAGTGMGEC